MDDKLFLSGQSRSREQHEQLDSMPEVLGIGKVIMIISSQRNFIFVHAPKTGGTSMALALEEVALEGDILIGDTPKSRKYRKHLKGIQVAGRLWKHSKLRDIVGLMTEEEISASCIFMLVRNPWDRMVSYYHWLKAQDSDHPVVKLSKELDFAGFVAHRVIDGSFRNHPYSSYVRNSSGQEYPCHFIRLENFEEDFRPVAEVTGLDITLPRVNSSNREAGIARYYTPETAALLANICAEDIRRFGYEFK